MVDINNIDINSLFNKERASKIKKARQYYANQNSICDRRRLTLGAAGELIESKFLTNNKLSHPFVREIVEQKVSYLLGKPFNIECKDEALAAAAADYFGKTFKRTLRCIARDAILCGEGWLMIFYDENEVLRFRRIAPENVSASYLDEDGEKLEYVVRKYFDANGDENYEVWDETSVVTCILQQGELIETSRRGHFGDTNSMNEDGERGVTGFGKIPFVQFKYNTDKLSILSFVKELIDDYDRISSDLSNLLQDTPNSLRIVKGYGEPIENLVRNMAIYNVVQMEENSDITNLRTSIDIQAIESHLNRLRKDIFNAAFAVDTQEASIGNLSGVAIKFRFSNLDLDCQQMGSEFAASMEEVAWFVCEDLKSNGRGEHDPASIDFLWAVELIANESEVISNIMNSTDILSRETLVAQHPYVSDPELEMERIRNSKRDVFA